MIQSLQLDAGICTDVQLSIKLSSFWEEEQQCFAHAFGGEIHSNQPDVVRP